ncbi:MAG: NAD(P)-dependent alcohol dehydrogenase [Actinomycetota bacterium]
MRAVRCASYTSVDELRVSEAAVPEIGPDQLLLRVEASSVNPFEFHMSTGTPYFLRLTNGLRRPKSPTLGSDVAGEVVAVGAEVDGFAVGDRVVGGADGAFAEFAVSKPKHLTHRPDSMSAEDGGPLSIAGLTALQGLRDSGQVEAGQRVLLVGAGGGVGTYAVQIAAAMGAEVTGVCSTGKVDLVRSLGARQVVDYTTDDALAEVGAYDVIFDVAGGASVGRFLRALTPGGRYVMASGDKSKRWLGPIPRVIGALIRSRFSSRTAVMFIASVSGEDMAELVALYERGELRTVIGHRFILDEIAEALAVIEDGHATGNVLVSP